MTDSDARFCRDLALPMGAQNRTRLDYYINNYETMCEMQAEAKDADSDLNGMSDQIPPYFYGTHYSTPLACVLYYLLRKEPFTQLHVALQDNHFDVSDRLFYSADVTCHCCLENLPEVKELIPEWYCDCAFLRNRNRQRFGRRQNGEDVDDVATPCSSAQFVSRNRQALESAHTASTLQDWIDLIFGWKQQGQPAVDAFNLFYYLTYPQKCDLTEVEDEGLKQAIITQATNFGQCPAVLFSDRHPAKRNDNVPRDLRSVLLETNTQSLYEPAPLRWLGNRCVITAVSDWDPALLLSCYSDVQRVLGSDSHPSFQQRVVAQNAALPVVRCPSPTISWPAESAYPWSVTVDNCDWMEMRLVKVVLEDAGLQDFNVKSNCFAVKVLKDGSWSSLSCPSQTTVRTPEGLVTLIPFSPVVCRFWRVEVVELPFQPVFVAHDLRTNRSTAPAPRCSLQGPTIKTIDVMGRMMFPHVPPPPRQIGAVASCASCALW